MITEIDPNTALVLIDLQKGILRMNLSHPVNEVLERASALIAAFRKASLPIVIVNVDPKGAAWISTRKESNAVRNTASAAAAMSDFSDIVDDIDVQPGDIRITKQTWNAFYGTSLHEQLQQHGITQIVIGGVSTSAGVEGTARAAAERGYNISFATDAMSDANEDAHSASLRNIFPRLGEQGSVAEVIEKLEQRN